MGITLETFMQYIAQSSRVKIVKAGNLIYAGWKASLRYGSEHVMEQYGSDTVKGFNVEIETRHKKWKEMGLLAPLQPEEMPDYSYKDLEQRVYFVFQI